MDQKQQIFLNIVSESKKILVVCNSAELDDQLAGSALVLALRSLGKNAFIAEAEKISRNLELDELKEADLESVGTELVISLKNNDGKINEVHYEKTDHPDQEIKIFLKSSSASLTERDIKIEKKPADFETVILAGIRQEIQLNSFKEKYFNILMKANVLSIDCLQPAQTFSNYQFFSPQCCCLAEAVLRAVFKLSPDKNQIGQTAANLILAGIMNTTENFINKKTTPETLSWAAELLKLGASPEKASEFLKHKQTEKPLLAPVQQNFNQLIQKVKSSNFLNWLTLDSEQSSKLEIEQDFLKITEFISESGQQNNSMVIAALENNNHQTIRGWLKTKSQKVSAELMNLLNGFMFNGILTFPIRAQSLAEAEKKMLKIAERVFNKQ